ncbi:YCII-related protein [Kribbella flavida DSM 17836]|uniref:YCII-related protein n=1 Tax=Kribbella flavida (strain DSM 17836 / JCM 10339 / NBRC 14399) TaxID=479435 RepID=D2PT55_KRIFD|nr:YciI family protein [Kribbella flavida]ADB29371.1 YCII-related protein [Kribbella flavida DSM 17836]
MKYLVLIYGTTDDTWTGSDDDIAAVRALTELKRDLTGTGELVSSEGLSYPSSGRVVQVRDGVRVVTDGPFGEAKEQIAGYFMVDASDERAQEIAGQVSRIVGDRVELRGTLLAAP